MQTIVDRTQEELLTRVREALDEFSPDVRAVVELEVQPPFTGESPEQVRILGRQHSELHG